MPRFLDRSGPAKQQSARRPCRPALRGDETGEFWLEFSPPPSDVDPSHKRFPMDLLMVLGAGVLLALAATLVPGVAV